MASGVRAAGMSVQLSLALSPRHQDSSTDQTPSTEPLVPGLSRSTVFANIPLAFRLSVCWGFFCLTETSIPHTCFSRQFQSHLLCSSRLSFYAYALSMSRAGKPFL